MFVSYDERMKIEKNLRIDNYKKLNEDIFLIEDEYSRLVDLKRNQFITPQFTKLTDFMELDGTKIASFEIALPYCSSRKTNFLYGVIDEFGNVIGSVVDFKTKKSYLVGDTTKVNEDGFKTYSFFELIDELSLLEEEYYIEESKEREKLLNLHINYKKYF